MGGHPVLRLGRNTVYTNIIVKSSKREVAKLKVRVSRSLCVCLRVSKLITLKGDIKFKFDVQFRHIAINL